MPPVVIDLCTPPPSPQHAAADSAMQVDLITPPSSPPPLEDAAVDEKKENAAGQKPSSSNAIGKHKAAAPVDSEQKPSSKALGKRKAMPPVEDDDEDMAVAALAPQPLAVRHDEEPGDDDDDVVFAGRTGDLALADFPHARENCVVAKWAPGNEHKTCANCFCYVCDAVASACPCWKEHCKATHTLPAWRQQRQQWAKTGGAGATSGGAAASAAAAAPAPAPRALPAGSRQPLGKPAAAAAGNGVWTCERVMKAVEQVYPVEARTPAGLTASLRPYQRQSLSFMLDVERSTDDVLAHPHLGRRGGWLADETGMGKTCVVAALILADLDTAKRWAKSGPGGADAQRKQQADFAARPPQGYRQHKQVQIHGEWYRSRGLSTDCEQPDEYLEPVVEVTASGYTYWKYDDSRSLRPEIKNPEYEAWKAPATARYHATVVLTTNSLLGQWADELAKWAPSLKVCSYYAASASRRLTISKTLDKYDVVLSTPGTCLFTGGYAKWLRIRRLVIDESHIGECKNLLSSFESRIGVGQTAPTFVWGLSATPMSSAVDDLGPLARILGQWDHSAGLNLRQYRNRRSELPQQLKRLMIRHSKSQRIGGEVALALPDAQVETAWLDMDADETSVHKNATILTTLTRFKSNPGSAKTFSVELALDKVRKACSGVVDKYTPGQLPSTTEVDGAKIKALLADLAALRVTDPNMHAVVFTHHKPAHDRISKRLAECGYEVCGFRGGVSAEKKHKTIRYFQESAEAAGRAAAASSSTAKKGRASSSAGAQAKAKVFVVTMKVGNVGITLTAATRVYLMEPCLDPAMEVQAAGRIHRLGQTKPVLVKRLCYKDSIDVRILELHKQIRAGKISIVDNVFPSEAIDVLKG